MNLRTIAKKQNGTWQQQHIKSGFVNDWKYMGDNHVGSVHLWITWVSNLQVTSIRPLYKVAYAFLTGRNVRTQNRLVIVIRSTKNRTMVNIQIKKVNVGPWICWKIKCIWSSTFDNDLYFRFLEVGYQSGQQSTFLTTDIVLVIFRCQGHQPCMTYLTRSSILTMVTARVACVHFVSFIVCWSYTASHYYWFLIGCWVQIVAMVI